MTDKKSHTPAQDPDAQLPVGPTDEDDTEGQMFINPGSSYDIAKARNKDVERQAREITRAKESRAKGK